MSTHYEYSAEWGKNMEWGPTATTNARVNVCEKWRIISYQVYVDIYFTSSQSPGDYAYFDIVMINMKYTLYSYLPVYAEGQVSMQIVYVASFFCI